MAGPGRAAWCPLAPSGLAGLGRGGIVLRVPPRAAGWPAFKTGREREDGMIEPLEGFPSNVVAIRASGEVSKHDYDAVLTPRVEAALAAHGKVRVYYEVGSDFAGFEPGAMWADFKMGMGHIASWDKVAVVTDVAWLQHAADFFRFMMPSEVKVFALAEAEAAKAWIRAA